MTTASSEKGPPPSRAAMVPSWRLLLAVLLFLNNVLSYADRTNMSIAITKMDGVSVAGQGWLLGAFYVGYLLTLIPGGYLATYYGAKPVLLMAVLLWTTFDVLSAALADVLLEGGSWGLFLLCVLRVGMGAGEGFCFPCQAALAGQWIPVNERSRLVSLYSSGMDFGTILALLGGPGLCSISSLGGWRFMFYFWGVGALAWSGLFSLLTSSTPTQHARAVRTGETAYIESQRAGSVKPVSFGWKWYFRHRQLWAIYAMIFGGNALWFALLSWLPKYFEAAFDGFRLRSNPVLLPLVFLCSWVGTLTWGGVADYLIKYSQNLFSTGFFL